MDEEIKQLCENLTSLISFENGDYKVYIHINKQNNKKYVGITCQDPIEKRWLNGKGYPHNNIFNNAIKKYGWDNFEHIILFNNINYDNACEIEQYLIKELQLQNIEYGYNIAAGGNANSMLGRHHSKETREKISQIVSERYAKNPNSHPWIGRKHTEESKQKMIQSSHSRQEVLCVETNEIYPSIREAARAVGLKSKNSILLALNDPNKTAKKYHWKRIINKGEE